MSTETTSAAPLINLAIYGVVVLALAGGVVWLGRWLERIAGTPPHRAAAVGARAAPSATWERTVPPHRRTAWLAHRATAEGWPRHSPFAFLEHHQHRAIWGVFGVALLLRVAFLGSIPDNVTADELDFAADALSILHGRGPDFFGLDWTPGPALSVYLIRWSWQLFGVTIFAERLVSALLTAIAAFPFYALLRRVVTTPAALAASALLMSSWWLLNFSRSGWNNGHIVLYMLLAAWALTRALERQRWLDWVGLGAALALLLYGYFSGRAVLIAFLAYLPLALWWRRRGTTPHGWRRPLAGALLAGVVCALLFLPMALVAARDITRFTTRTSSVFILNQPREPSVSIAAVLAQQTWTTIRSFVLMDTSTGEGRYKGPGMAWLDPLSAALYLVGLVLATRRGRATVLWWCLLLIPLGLTQVLSNGIPDGARGLAAVAPMYFFAALTLDAIVARRWLRAPAAQVALAGIVVFTMALNVRAYSAWMARPEALAVRQPAISADEFPRWRDFQRRRLEADARMVNADEYRTLPPATIDAWIAGGTPDLAAALPQEIAVRHVATIGAAGQLATPRSAAVDDEGFIYVADPERGKIVRYAADGTFLTEWGDPAQLVAPSAIIVAPDSTLVVLDVQMGQIARYDRQGAFLGLVAKIGGPARGMALGRDGRIYVANTGNNRLIVLPGTGPDPVPLAEPATTGPALDQPTAIIAAADGTIYIYEPTAARLRAFDRDGQPLFAERAPGGDTVGAGGLALLPDGRLLLANPAARRVMVYSPGGALLGSFSVEGTPQGLGVTPGGLVVVTDALGQRIRLYDLGGS